MDQEVQLALETAVHCLEAILTQSPLLLSTDSAGSLRRGDHILNMVLAMHSWVLPSDHLAARLLTLYPPRAMSSGGGQRAEM